MTRTGPHGPADRPTPGRAAAPREEATAPAPDDAAAPAGAAGPARSPDEAPGTLADRASRLWELAASVPDPELPVLTLAELGVLRALREHAPGRVEVELTPTYTGCPALETMATDVAQAVRGADGVTEVVVRTVLSPAWSTDDISATGRRKLAEAGIAPPRAGASGPVPVGLGPTRHAGDGIARPEAGAPPTGRVHCPHCGSPDTTLLSRFSSTACKALRRCESCREPFDHFKEL